MVKKHWLFLIETGMMIDYFFSG